MRFMHGICGVVAAGAVAISTVADETAVREGELDVVTDVQRVSVAQAIDLRTCWPVEVAGRIGVPYSAVGWDLSPHPVGAVVRLDCVDGVFVDGIFVPRSDGRRVLAYGLTGKGTIQWIPTGERKVYRIFHETICGGRTIEGETLCAYFDFSNCRSLTDAMKRAVQDVSQPVAFMDDPLHPWSCAGGDGEGLQNAADGATLTVAFSGAGAFVAELMFSDGAVTVAVDGRTTGTVPPTEGWTRYLWTVEDYDAHTLTLTYNGTAGVSVRKCALTNGVVGDVDSWKSGEMPCDLRNVFPVANLKNDPALKGLMYSAIGWERNAVEDALSTVSITARSGTLAKNGTFMPDGTAGVTVLPATGGRGQFDWKPPPEISTNLYQLTHSVQKNGVADAGMILYGYLDFTNCDMERASQKDVEAAVLGEFTNGIAVTQDADSPWQPIDPATVRSGLMTDDRQDQGEETMTAFAFVGRGVLHYDYAISGGVLKVFADGECIATFADPTADWVTCQVPFSDYDVHECEFRYVADGRGVASIRNVRWESDESGFCAEDVSQSVCADLREGVRRPRRLADVLPFEYSSTNWIGDVVGVSSTSVAKVTIVQLTGTDPDVRNWTEEVPNTFKELVKKVGEGQINWRPKKGVWKATFVILNGDDGVHTETAVFDLRESSGMGLMLILK